MKLRFQLQGVDFEWHAEKARINSEKHGITFEEAATVFFDPFYQEGEASRGDEHRQFIIGYSRFQNLLLTIYLERGALIRLISARPATRHERKLYEES